MKQKPPKTKTKVDSELWFWKIFDAYIERSKLKQTQQRRLIASYFLRLRKHVGAEELRHAMRKEGCDIGIATIYRTLQFLSQAGLAEEKFFEKNKSSVFELHFPHSHHDHLVCKKCRTVIEFENKDIEKHQKNIAKKYGFTLLSHRLELFGYCRSCSSKQVA